MYRIYMITGSNGRSYIGMTSRTEHHRMRQHIKDAGRHRMPIGRAIKKYGEEAFTIRVLAECVDRREAAACERGLIAQYGTLCSAGGYNVSLGGAGIGPGFKHSDETKEHLRQLAKEQKAHLHLNTPEVQARARATTKAKGPATYACLHTPEVKAKLTADRRAKAYCPWFHTPEVRAKMAATKRGRIVPHLQTKESRAKRDASHRATLSARPYRPEDPEVTKRRIALSSQRNRRNRLYGEALTARGNGPHRPSYLSENTDA